MSKVVAMNEVSRTNQLLADYATSGSVFSVYQEDGMLWHKRGEISGPQMAKIMQAMRQALSALESVTLYAGKDPAKVDGAHLEAIDCDLAINALREYVKPARKAKKTAHL